MILRAWDVFHSNLNNIDFLRICKMECTNVPSSTPPLDKSKSKEDFEILINLVIVFEASN